MFNTEKNYEIFEDIQTIRNNMYSIMTYFFISIIKETYFTFDHNGELILEIKMIGEGKDNQFQKLDKKNIEEIQSLQTNPMFDIIFMNNKNINSYNELYKSLLIDEMRKILLHTTEGIIAFDREGKIALINPAARKLLKISPEDKLGESSAWSYYIAKEVIQRTKTVEKIGVKGASKSNGNDFSRQLTKSEYLDMAKRFCKYVEEHNQLPNNSYQTEPIATLYVPISLPDGS